MVLQSKSGAQVARGYCPAFQSKAFEDIRWLPKANEEQWAALEDFKANVPSPEKWKTMTLGEQDKALQGLLRDLQRSLYGRESAENDHADDRPANPLHNENPKIREIDLTEPEPHGGRGGQSGNRGGGFGGHRGGGHGSHGGGFRGGRRRGQGRGFW